MGDRLGYDSVVLAQLASDLSTTTDNLKNDEDLEDYGIEDVAHEKVDEALSDFVGDWDDKRKKLVDKVEALSVMASESQEKFTDADKKLADALQAESK